MSNGIKFLLFFDEMKIWRAQKHIREHEAESDRASLVELPMKTISLRRRE